MPADEYKYSDCLYFSSSALARMLTRIAEEQFNKTGLSPSHAYLLMTVIDRPGIQPGEISKELLLAPSTVTRLVEKMEAEGYLSRTSEGRATRVEPTDRALALGPELVRSRKELQQLYASKLGERYTRVLTEMAFKAYDLL